jgi:ABC-2 type transport system permease protein
MRKVMAIAWKDALIRFSGRSEILFFLVLPVVFTSLGGAFGGGDGRIALLLVDDDRSEYSAQLAEALGATGTLRLVDLGRDEAEAQLARGDAPALLIIPAGFGQALLADQAPEVSLRRLPGDINALAAQTAVAGALEDLGRALRVARRSVEAAEQVRPFGSAAEREAWYRDSLAMAQQLLAEAPARVTVTQATAAEPAGGYDNQAQASAGQLITWVFIPLLATSALMSYERSRGTLRRLVTTPTGKSTFLLGTIFGQLALALVQMALLVGFGLFVLGLPWGQSPAALVLMLVTFGLAAVALGTMMGTFVKTENQAGGLSIMLGMSMALLGGCWYPLELFPDAARTFALALPTRWAMQGLTDIVMRGQGLESVWQEASVLLGFAAAFFVVGVARFRYE